MAAPENAVEVFWRLAAEERCNFADAWSPFAAATEAACSWLAILDRV